MISFYQGSPDSYVRILFKKSQQQLDFFNIDHIDPYLYYCFTNKTRELDFVSALSVGIQTRIFLTIERLGLTGYVDAKDFRRQGGCFVPRHMCWNPKNRLSRHSWGIAIDLNVNTNPYGAKGNMHRGIIKVFEDYGFLWGGAWRTPDPMHFEAGKAWKPFRPTKLLKHNIQKQV